MPREPHNTMPLQVWVDIDVDVADLVARLNTIPGVRTYSSCRGSMDEPEAIEPFPAYVSVSWATQDTLLRLAAEFDMIVEGEGYGTVHRKGTRLVHDTGVA